jgi:hypothetical protein
MRKNCYKRDKPANHIKCLPSTTSAYRIRLRDTVETMSFTVETGENRSVHFRINSVKNGLVFLGKHRLSASCSIPRHRATDYKKSNCVESAKPTDA